MFLSVSQLQIQFIGFGCTIGILVFPSSISSKYYGDDESRPPLLQPPEDSIVPLENGRKTPAAANTRFSMHHTQANTKKIYIKDFALHLQGMLDDSGYKFSEEYEVPRVYRLYEKEGII